MTKSSGGVFKQTNEKKGKKYDVMVIRIDNKDKENVQLVNARPCQNCLEMMKSIGIHRVYYSDDYGEMVCENIKDMISIHSSRVMIKFDIQSKINTSKTITNDTKNINEDRYWEYLIKNKIPNIVKEVNFNNFINYDFKSLESRYKMVIIKIGYEKKVQIINSSNQVIKTILVV